MAVIAELSSYVVTMASRNSFSYKGNLYQGLILKHNHFLIVHIASAARWGLDTNVPVAKGNRY